MDAHHLPPTAIGVTSTTLLQGLRDPANRTAWAGYVGRYRPLVVAWARRLGLPHGDAEDLAQAALLDFSSAYRAGRYDRSRGRLSSWLFGIVRNHVRRWHEHAGRERARGTAGEAVLEQVPAEDALERLWREEWAAAVLRAALAQVRREVAPATLRAFERFVLDELPAAQVARELDTTQNAVFKAKRRVLARVRELLPELEEAW